MRVLLPALVALTALAACDASEPEMEFGDAINASGTACLDGELAVEVLDPSPSGQPVSSFSVTVDYVGQRRPLGASTDAPFDFEFDSGSSASFNLSGPVIAGFRAGILGTDDIAPMRLGERRELIIPPGLGYGFQGLRNQQDDFVRDADGNVLVPQCATLRFDVTLRDFM